MKPASSSTSEKMKTVKASCDSAPSGEKKTAAMKHFHAAETAQTAKDDVTTHKELDAATHALGLSA